MIFKKTDIDLELLKSKLILYGYEVEEIENDSALLFTSHNGTKTEIPWTLFLKIVNPEFEHVNAKTKRVPKSNTETNDEQQQTE